MAFGLARASAFLIRGVRPDDPLVFGAITVLISLIAMGSSWIPARRAARIEPMVALHDE
jgi:ABC-type lipoprotein release transport system permease subunit